LEDTNPGHYGVEDLEFQVPLEDIFVRIPERTFDYKNSNLRFIARIGGSSDESGTDATIEMKLSGAGAFHFEDGKVIIDKISTNEELDLFPGQD
jgi:hypothetical protein